jgi:predicted restriction endonuclease
MLSELKRVQAPVGTGSLKVALQKMLKNYLKHQDPLEKARRSNQRKEKLGAGKVSKTPASHEVARPQTKAIPRAVLHEVYLRDRGLCQFKGSRGKKCLSPYWVQTHHLEHRAYGGKHDAKNLLTLCQRHHQFSHRHNDLKSAPATTV